MSFNTGSSPTGLNTAGLMINKGTSAVLPMDTTLPGSLCKDTQTKVPAVFPMDKTRQVFNIQCVLLGTLASYAGTDAQLRTKEACTNGLKQKVQSAFHAAGSLSLSSLTIPSQHTTLSPLTNPTYM